MTSDRVAYSQARRMMAVETPLGPDVPPLEHLVIEEAVNEPFTFQLGLR